MTTPDPTQFPWGEFLEARANLIDYFAAEGKPVEIIAHELSMDPLQVKLIAERAKEPSAEFMRGASWAKTQIDNGKTKEFVQMMAVFVRQYGAPQATERPGDEVKELRIEKSGFIAMPPHAQLVRDDSPDGTQVVFRLAIAKLDS